MRTAFFLWLCIFSAMLIAEPQETTDAGQTGSEGVQAGGSDAVHSAETLNAVEAKRQITDTEAVSSRSPEEKKSGVPEGANGKRTSKNGRKSVQDLLDRLDSINRKIAGTEDEARISDLLMEQDRRVNDLLGLLREADEIVLPAAADRQQLNFLVSRMAINEKRGNRLAVERDKAKLAYFNTVKDVKHYLEFLIEASRRYKTVDEVVDYSVNLLNRVKQEADKMASPAGGETESPIFREWEANFQDYRFSGETFQDILSFVVNNPSRIVEVPWFKKFSLISVIAFFNQAPFIKPLNYKLEPFNIDAGGIIVSLVIVVLIVFCFPLVLRGSSWLIDRYVTAEKTEHSEMIVHALKRPIKFLLLFFSLDLATYALLYKTEYKASLEDFVFVVYTWLLIWLLFRLTDSIVYAQIDKISRTNKELRKELVNLGIQTVKGVVAIVALSVVLSRFGISITAIMSTLGIGGLAFALAAKDSLSNLFGGITILFDNIYRMGDWVKIGDVEGTVVEIGLRSTTIRTFDNALITIPNATVSVSSVMNWNRRAVGRRIKMHVGVTYESDMDDIRRALQDIRSMLTGHPDIANPKEKHGNKKALVKLTSREDVHGIKTTQLVFLDRYNDFSIDILIYCFSKTVDWAKWLAVKEDLLFRIADILKKNNLEFAYPTEVRINREDKGQET
ncbi:MAG: mechanosensitive ion channel family protein [Gammaproteobacteria bacterium]